MGLANWLKSLVLPAKYLYGEILRKNGNFGELVDWVCYRFVTARGVARGEGYGLEFCGGTCAQKCDRENDGGGARCYLSVSTTLNV